MEDVRCGHIRKALLASHVMNRHPCVLIGGNQEFPKVHPLAKRQRHPLPRNIQIDACDRERERRVVGVVVLTRQVFVAGNPVPIRRAMDMTKADRRPLERLEGRSRIGGPNWLHRPAAVGLPDQREFAPFDVPRHCRRWGAQLGLRSFCYQHGSHDLIGYILHCSRRVG